MMALCDPEIYTTALMSGAVTEVWCRVRNMLMVRKLTSDPLTCDEDGPSDELMLSTSAVTRRRMSPVQEKTQS